MSADSHNSTSQLASRKDDHLDLCMREDVGFQERTNLFDDLDLVHNAIPEMAAESVDLRVRVMGRTLKAPLVIAAMTGGTARAEQINRDLASLAEELGIAFAFGSQRPLLSSGTLQGYQVRDLAPNTLVFGNISAVQARDVSTDELAAILDVSGCDALCVHLNPAMELVQPKGDRDFTGCVDAIRRLGQDLGRPLVVKETGCGLSRVVGRRLASLGVEWVDVSGAGGTSWTAVESMRARGARAELGRLLWDWGIPTAGCVAQLDGLPLRVIATGGMGDGIMAAKALSMGAELVGLARPVLRAWDRGGQDGARDLLQRVIMQLQAVMLLTGSRTLGALRNQPLVIGPRLARWLPETGSLRRRMLG